MAVTPINTLKNWFKTGLKPTQEQFWDWLDSFRHKSEKVPVADIEGIDQLLFSKADKQVFETHLNDPNAHAELIGGKLDKGAFPGTAENLDNRIAALEMPDKVLKYGQINVSGLNLTIAENAFAWVLSQINFLTPGAYAKTITAATDGMYRTDIVAGNGFGSYELIQGSEASTGQAATEPNVPSGKIKVGYVLVFGNTIAKSGNSEGVDLSGELKFAAYPNTRNDGQISMNKVLGTDSQGNLKMYTIATAPAPYMEVLIPDSTLPSTTTNFTIKGAFFTPSMTVDIVGQTVNYLVFVSDNLIKVNVTTGDAEGMFAVTLNNGISATYPNALSIVLGTVYAPAPADWEAPTGVLDVSGGDDARVVTYESRGTNRWNKTLNISKNFYLRFQIAKTPTGYTANNEYEDDHIVLVKSSDNTKAFSMYLNRQVGGNISMIYWCPTFQYGNPGNAYGLVSYEGGNTSSQNMNAMCLKTYDFRWLGGVMYIYVDNVLKCTLVDVPTENLKLKVSTKTFDIVNIKYIELL